MARCTRCLKEFALFLAFDQTPEGLKLNGIPYCWACFEEVVAEIESGAQPKETVHR